MLCRYVFFIFLLVELLSNLYTIFFVFFRHAPYLHRGRECSEGKELPLAQIRSLPLSFFTDMEPLQCLSVLIALCKLHGSLYMFYLGVAEVWRPLPPPPPTTTRSLCACATAFVELRLWLQVVTAVGTGKLSKCDCDFPPSFSLKAIIIVFKWHQLCSWVGRQLNVEWWGECLDWKGAGGNRGICPLTTSFCNLIINCISHGYAR